LYLIEGRPHAVVVFIQSTMSAAGFHNAGNKDMDLLTKPDSAATQILDMLFPGKHYQAELVPINEKQTTKKKYQTSILYFRTKLKRLQMYIMSMLVVRLRINQ